LLRGVPNRHLRDTLGSKGFFRTSVPNIALITGQQEFCLTERKQI
jgi:hypothetical protein